MDIIRVADACCRIIHDNNNSLTQTHVMSRPLINRLMDRAWTEISKRLEKRDIPPSPQFAGESHSVSGTLAWPAACAALADGSWQSPGFRRTKAVREVVETLGLSDARYFAQWIKSHSPEWLRDKQIRDVNDWGDPIQAPAWILGIPHAFSPTSLRYLAHALWLKQDGIVKQDGLVVEIGVGFGGLAAANALVSNARTVCIDLPEVNQSALLMMRENKLDSHIASVDEITGDFCLISNYAFTELSSGLQDHYFEQIIRHASRGAILSNASIFAKHIGGRNDDDIVSWFRSKGIPAAVDAHAPILGPADYLCDVHVIRWDQAQKHSPTESI